jgi:predicted amidohydrolase
MPYKIAIAQFQPKIGDIYANREKILDFAEQAADANADLLLLPELSLTGYLLRDEVFQAALKADDPFLDPIRKISRKISVCFGLAEMSSDYRYFNSAFYYEDDRLLHVHRKVYLPTYGVFEEKRFFAEGDRVRAFNASFGRLGIAICNDMWHPSLPWLLAMDGADLILVCAASPTRGVNHGEINDNARVWDLLLCHTAKTSSVCIAFANLCGFQDGLNFWGCSRLVAPNGKTVAQTENGEEALIVAETNRGILRRERVYSPLRRDERLLLTYHELRRIIEDKYR